MNEKERIQKCWDKMIEETCDGNKSAFARLLKMTPQSFQQYYNLDRRPGWDILKRIAALGYRLDWLVIGLLPAKINELKSSNVSSFELNYNAVEESNNDYFDHINRQDLSEAEAEILAEVKQFSDFLESRPLRPQVKRLLLELLIRSIDQAIEQPPPDPDDS